MGVGAIFLAMEARQELGAPSTARTTTGSAQYRKEEAIALVWPVICFTVLCSTMIHGLSTAVISVGGHYQRKSHERAPLLGQETEGLEAMEHSDGSDSEPEISGTDDEM